MSRISVRGFAVASATAVTAVGSVVGVASGSTAQMTTADDAEAVANDSTLLAGVPVGQQALIQTASLTAQADAQAIAADARARKDAEETARKKAAQDAIDKQKAAEKAEQERKAKEEAEAKAEAAGSLGNIPVQSSYSIAEVRTMAQAVVASDQWICFSNIVKHESTWNYKAVNPSSGAYGLFQALPGSKMASAGSDWQTNPATQIKWGLNYMESTYGSPCGAWDFWLANHWY